MSQEDKRNIYKIFPDTYYELVRLSKEYVTCLIIDILARSNIDRLVTSEFISVDKIILDLNFIQEAKIPVYWMLSYLRDRGFIEEKQINKISYFKKSGDFPDIDPDKVNDRMLKIDSNVLPSNLLLEKAAKGYPDFLRGKRNAIDILFTDDKMDLWTNYFNNNNSGYVVYNSFATLGLLKWLPDKDDMKILEVGGGTGSASIFFLKEMCKKGLVNRVGKYIFSDTSPIFLRVGNKTMIKELPDTEMIQLKTLDFNRSFDSQGIKPDSVDMIFGVNSVHAAVDLVRSLEFMNNVLKPGGSLLLSECVRPGENGLLFQELIFNLFYNYREVKLSAIRPMPGFLDIKSWKRIFEKAKFKNIELLTNVDYDIKKNFHQEVFAMVIKGDK